MALPAGDRRTDYSNTTESEHVHPREHNEVNDAINKIVDHVRTLQLTPGPEGPAGPAGPPGEPGTRRFSGEGPPTVVPGASAGDEYIDVLTGDIYYLI